MNRTSSAPIAQQHLVDCHLCPHHCGAARASAHGVCRVGQTTYIASEMLHMGEEEPRARRTPSFSSRTATCVLCTAAKFASDPLAALVAAHRRRASPTGSLRAPALSVRLRETLPHIPLSWRRWTNWATAEEFCGAQQQLISPARRSTCSKAH